MMKLGNLQIEFRELPGAVAAWQARVDASGWRDACTHVQLGGGRLVALWGSDGSATVWSSRFAVHAALVVQPGLIVLTLPIVRDEYPDVSDVFPAASRMQRATAAKARRRLA